MPFFSVFFSLLLLLLFIIFFYLYLFLVCAIGSNHGQYMNLNVSNYVPGLTLTSQGGRTTGCLGWTIVPEVVACPAAGQVGESLVQLWVLSLTSASISLQTAWAGSLLINPVKFRSL